MERASIAGVLGNREPIVATIALLVLLVAKPASASPTSRLVYLRGEGAESCPEEPEMRRAVAARLGYDPFRPLAATTLTAEVKRDKGVFRGRVRLVDDAGVERGTRDLESRASDCRDLTTAMALSMSIAIDPLSLMRAPTDEPDARAAPRPGPAESTGAVAEPAPPAPTAPTAPKEADVPLPDRPPPDPWRLALGVGGHAAFGIAPAVAPGLRVSSELVKHHWSLGLEGRFDLPASASSEEGGRSQTSLVGGALVPCVRVPLVWACGVLLVARIDAEALEVSRPRSEAFVLLGGGLRLQASIELPESFHLRIGADALAHPNPFELALNGRRVHRSSDVSAIAGISLARIF